MDYQIELFKHNGWKHDDAVIATITADDLDDAQAQALRLVGATAGQEMDAPYDAALDGIHERRLVVDDPDPDMLDASVQNLYDEGGYRLTIHAWPCLGLPAADAVNSHPSDAEAITAAFERMRTAGIDAREDFECCSSCAWHAIDDGPAAFYNQQSTESSFGEDPYRSENIMYPLAINFGDDDSDNVRNVGIQVMQALQQEGLMVDWNGNPQRSVLVTGRVPV